MVSVITSRQVVAKCVWDTLHALEEKHLSFLLNFLCLTKCTAICEILQPDNQHITNIRKLEKPLLNVISFTPSAGDESHSSLVALPPHHTLDLLSSLGLTVPAYTVIQAGDVQRYRNEVCPSALMSWFMSGSYYCSHLTLFSC